MSSHSTPSYGANARARTHLVRDAEGPQIVCGHLVAHARSGEELVGIQFIMVAVLTLSKVAQGDDSDVSVHLLRPVEDREEVGPEMCSKTRNSEKKSFRRRRGATFVPALEGSSSRCPSSAAAHSLALFVVLHLARIDMKVSQHPNKEGRLVEPSPVERRLDGRVEPRVGLL